MAGNQVCVGNGLFVDTDGILKVRTDNTTIVANTTAEGPVLATKFKPFPAHAWPYGGHPGYGQQIFEYNGNLHGAPPNSITSYAEIESAPNVFFTDPNIANENSRDFRGRTVYFKNTDVLQRKAYVTHVAFWDGFEVWLPRATNGTQARVKFTFDMSYNLGASWHTIGSSYFHPVLPPGTTGGGITVTGGPFYREFQWPHNGGIITHGNWCYFSVRVRSAAESAAHGGGIEMSPLGIKACSAGVRVHYLS